jgi:hypothetical protein
MLTGAFLVLLVAALVGAALATLHLRVASARAVPPQFATLHALLGLAGLAILAPALGGPPRGAAQGTASFGVIAAALVALAVVAAGGMLMRRFKGRPPGALLGVHATLAISGVAMLAAYVLS